MPTYLLRTLGTLALEGPRGPLRLDPVALGLLCLVLVGEGGGISRGDACRLLPELGDGNQALDDVLARIGRAAGTPLVRADGPWLAADRTLLGADVEMAPAGGSADGARFLSGFNLPASAPFLDWARARRQSLRPASGIAPSQRRLPAAGTILLGLLGLAGVAAVYLTRVTPPAGFVAGDPVAVVAADSHALTGAFAVAALSELGRSGYLTPFAATARGDQPDLVLTVRARAEGDRTWLVAAIRAGSARVLVDDSVAASGDRAILDGMDRLLDRVRRAAGEGATERAAHPVRVRRLTPSIAALEAYATGLARLDRADRPGARQAWLAALDADSSFAQAAAQLGHDALGRGDTAAARRFYQRALVDPDRLPVADRSRLTLILSQMTADRSGAP